MGNTPTELHPPQRSRVEITDAADTDEFLESAYGVSMRVRRPPTARRENGLLLAHARISVGPFEIEDIYLTGEVDFAPDPLNKVMAVCPIGGRVSSECARLRSKADAGGVAILAQHDVPYRAHTDDLHVTNVVLEPSLVAGVATGLPEGQAPLPIRFSSFAPVDASAARRWKRTVRFVRDCVLADDAIATPLVLGHASRLLAAVTLSTFPNTAEAGPAPYDRTDHSPVLLRRAIEYIDANATSDIALADIAQAVHVTPRAVQYMFRRHLDTTPLGYLRTRRLQEAHRELVAADQATDTVTGIAARWGFAHTGRFAVLYRQTFGQSPRQTLVG